MKWMIGFTAAVALMASVPATAADVEFKPIDSKKLVVQPSKVAAKLAAGTINLVGQTAAGSIENNGYVKTINNLLGFKRMDPRVQAGKSALPAPYMFQSTKYKSSITPTMPTTQSRNR
jgi:hypothetical protein